MSLSMKALSLLPEDEVS